VGVPWELLYDEHTDQFLALAPDLTLVRYPEMPAAHAQPGPLRVEGPLQVVAVLASPTDDYYPRLRLDRELGRLEHALKLLRDKNQVQLDVIRGPGTLDQLRERLRQPVHILHILSHGDLNRETGEGELLFEDTDGAAEPINAYLLRQYLERQRGQVQLVTLNACLGALPVENDAFSSVGLSLIRGGVPAVVAMQFEIAEDVAAELTRVLYAELAAGMPIDQAVNEARLHISGRYRTRLDWAIPVLFSRAETGMLFAFAEARANLTEQVKQEEPPPPPEPVLDPVALKQMRREALIAYYRRDWEQAEVLLAQVADADPTDADVQTKLHEARQQQRWQAQYRLVRDLRDAGQWQAVLNALADLAQHYPDAPDPDRHRAWAEAQQRREQQYDAALQACDQGDWDSAQAELEALLRESPDDEAAKGLLATVREQQQEIWLAEQLQQVRTLMSQNMLVAAEERLREVLTRFRDHDEARHLQASVREQIAQLDAEVRKAREYFEEDELEKARSILETLLATHPEGEGAQAWLDRVMARQRELEEQEQQRAEQDQRQQEERERRQRDEHERQQREAEKQAHKQREAQQQPPRPAPPKSKPSSPAVIEIAPGVTMEFVEVPAGNFLMGSSDADPDAEADEKPQHELYLPTYWIGKTPVTNAQFRPFVEGDGYSNPDYWTKDGWQEKNRVQPYYWRDKKWNGAEYPVVGIAWYEAMAYVAWLRTRTGDDCRLPTEAEWEKAARGTDGRIYPWGSVWEEGRCNYARGGLMGIFAAQQTSPVGKFVNGASPYGALDMVGNVWEWTRSEFRDYPYDADDGRENVDALAGKWFTLRGGSWYWDRTGVRCAARYRGFPGGSGSDGGCRVLFSPRASP
jgi:formylglycine-generating enzyme required for sulfatase activity